MTLDYFLLTLFSAGLLTVSAEEFRGRHVCTSQKMVPEPVAFQQSYIRAVHRKDIQRVVYQTAYKTVFKMQLRPENVTGCCPGWEKRTPRDPNCLKPLCEEGCENEGQCVGPGICVCNEGYTGYRCQIDIDECSGRNSCQQKCTNLPGSYECSCQAGFILTDDEYSCDLCISCTEEYKNLYSRMEQMQNLNHQEEVIEDIKEQVETLSHMVVSPDRIQAIQNKLNNLSQSVIPAHRFQDLQMEVHQLKDKIKQVDIIDDLNSRVYYLEESSLDLDKVTEIEKLIDDIDEVKTLVESVQRLNDTVQRLQEDDKHATKLEDMQKQIEDLAIIKAQQDGTQAEKLEEMSEGLKQLQLVSTVLDSVSEIKDQFELLSESLEALEADKDDNIRVLKLQVEGLQHLQNDVTTIKEKIKQVDVIEDLNTRLDELEKKSLHTEQFQEIHNKIDDLSEVKTLVESVQSLNHTVKSLQEDDTQARKVEDLQKQLEDLTVAKVQQDEAQADRMDEIQKELEQLREMKTLSVTVMSLKEIMEQMSSRIQQLEADKAALKNNLTEAVTYYESAISALQAKEVFKDHEMTTEIYESDRKISIDRLVSLSEQISILEEKMADCSCVSDYG